MSKKIIILAIVIVVIVTIVIITTRGTEEVKEVTEEEVTEEIKEVKVKAFRFGYVPDEITVSKGNRVKIVIDNTDATHGMRIPELGISGDDIVEFTAEESGEFSWYCKNYCGSGHGDMKGKLIVQ